MRHFGGLKLLGATVLCKCDDAEEIKGPATLMAWLPFPDVARDWPHNTHCERDIGVTKNMSSAIFVTSGFPEIAGPSVLEFVGQARSFFTDAPIYPYEVGTPQEEDKKREDQV